MKRTIAIFALLATSCALAQGLQRPQGLLGRRLNSPLLRPPAQAPQEVYEKVPEECRASVTSAIAKKAWDAATAEVSEKFGVIVSPGKWESSWSWTNDCGKGVILFGDSFACRKFSADGRLLQTGTEDTFEEFKWRDSRRDELIAAYWNDPAIVAEAVSNSMAEVERQSRSFDARKSFPSLLSRLSSRRRGLLEERIPQKDRIQLEERIPIEEALSLAKDGKGKGFYQLAVRYALGDELPKDPKLAYQMLKKACAVNYANAILVEGLCDEYSLDGGDKYASVREAMRDYCGTADFATGRWRRDSLTNEVAVARVMGKYERAKELGVLTATNQIAALNKRLAEFKKEEAEERQKVRNAKKTEENNRRVAEEAKENNRRVKEALGADAQVEDSYEFEIKQKEASEKRYESAFKELVGFEMGQVVVSDSGSKDIVLKQPYRYFKDCELMYEAGRVYGAKLKFISEKNYSQKSLEQEARTTSKDVARRFDITYSDSVTDLWWRFPGAYPIGDFSAMAWTNDWAFCVSGGSGDTRILLIIRNDALHERLKRQRTEKEEAQKATLPVFGTGKQE